MLTPRTIWLAREPVDMRRGIDTLTQLVAAHLLLPWQDGCAVVFCNKSRSRIKVLQWDKHGVWLCSRRLHQGHFTWPRQGENTWAMTTEQFNWLIKGVNWQHIDGYDLSHWEV